MKRLNDFFSTAKQTFLGGRQDFKIMKMGFDIVHGCQLRCIGCPNSTIKPKIYHIPVDDFQKCLKHVDADYIHLFRFFNFGEALLHPDLPTLVNQIREYSFKVNKVELSTNTQNCDFTKLSEVFKGKQINILAVSCDGDGTPEEYERIRTPAKWERLIEFLTKSKELRDKYHPELKLITRTVCETEEGQRRWREIVEPLGWTPQFRGWLNLPDSKRTLNKPKVDKNGLCIYMSEREKCCYIDTDGTVVPCCLHPKAYVLGNLKEQRLSEIFSGEQRKNFRRLMRKKRSSLPVCSQCEVF
jgi:radical SAM protein with 4Fe4S-binding SPASM domain